MKLALENSSKLTTCGRVWGTKRLKARRYGRIIFPETHTLLTPPDSTPCSLGSRAWCCKVIYIRETTIYLQPHDIRIFPSSYNTSTHSTSHTRTMCYNDYLKFGCGHKVYQKKTYCGKEGCTTTTDRDVAYSTGNCYDCATSHVSLFLHL